MKMRIGRWYRVKAFEENFNYIIKPTIIRPDGSVEAKYRYQLEPGQFSKRICEQGLFYPITEVRPYKRRKK